MICLPLFLTKPENEEFWEWETDGWKPKAKPNAPDEIKRAIEKWLAEVEAAKNDCPDGEIVFL